MSCECIKTTKINGNGIKIETVKELCPECQTKADRAREAWKTEKRKIERERLIQERVNDNARKKAERELINEGLIEEEEK